MTINNNSTDVELVDYCIQPEKKRRAKNKIISINDWFSNIRRLSM
jgi:hypothetical protein